MTVAEEIQSLGKKARAAARALRTLETREKNAALLAIAEALEAAKPEIDAANAEDVAAAQANGAEPSDEVPEGTVIRQWKPGFRIGDKLLRPAVVVVSSGPAAPAAPAGDGSPEAGA